MKHEVYSFFVILIFDFCFFVFFLCVSRISCNVYCLQKLKNVVHSDKLLFCQALAAAQSLISQVMILQIEPCLNMPEANLV